ncbi:hypothetical protein U27_00083 [Candidatus Vecturithrix granuli]|uniref:DUF2281 domain-containing protein n=1 Tax=Vecturithrix granuli TaxID=1499967 RepID=A0A081C6I7_VECG1|nr:hypothetical protein U27_00083 [Candidatus Vecturithrix granuli]
MIQTARMEKEQVWLEFSTLPLDAQYQVLEFMLFLHARYTLQRETAEAQKTKLSDEPFVGIWKDREEMRDSGIYVRTLRQQEWGSDS